MSSKIIKIDEEYKGWIQDIGKRFRQSQIKAATKVNGEMLEFYWALGKDLSDKKEHFPWGSQFYKKVSKDLSDSLPDVKSFSPRNLLYMQQFYEMYSSVEFAPQVGAQIQVGLIAPQVGAQLRDAEKSPQLGDESSPGFVAQKSPQLGAREISILAVPWGHHRIILDKCKGDRDKAFFYVRKTVENNWSRAVLLNFLDTNLYERQGKAVSNFALTLPPAESDLAQAITRDPYNFDFLTIRERYDEKELKDALIDNITKFLLELGNGFAFVGREVRLEIGQTENFVDMLFYNIKLHCYVVVEVKVKDFDSGDMGQLGTYMVAVNHQLKGEGDNPTLGLLICRSKDNVKAEYALEASSQPMGISEYDISSFMPENYKSSLPSIEEIEAELESDKYRVE